MVYLAAVKISNVISLNAFDGAYIALNIDEANSNFFDNYQPVILRGVISEQTNGTYLIDGSNIIPLELDNFVYPYNKAVEVHGKLVKGHDSSNFIEVESIVSFDGQVIYSVRSSIEEEEPYNY